MPRLGEFFVSASPSFSESASPEASFGSADFETPSDIKLMCPLKDARYFSVQRDDRQDLPPVHRLVGMDEIQFRKLVQESASVDCYTTMSAARARADEMNRAAYEEFRRLRGSIIVPVANNQAFKL